MLTLPSMQFLSEASCSCVRLHCRRAHGHAGHTDGPSFTPHCWQWPFHWSGISPIYSTSRASHIVIDTGSFQSRCQFHCPPRPSAHHCQYGYLQKSLIWLMNPEMMSIIPQGRKIEEELHFQPFPSSLRFLMRKLYLSQGNLCLVGVELRSRSPEMLFLCTLISKGRWRSYILQRYTITVFQAQVSDRLF